MISGLLPPSWRRNVIEPLIYGAKGSPRLRYWRELEESQFLPTAELRQRQWQRLEQLLRFVWDYNPFYRCRLEQAGVAPERVRHPEDLRAIPLLSKKEIRCNTSALISRGYIRDRLLHYKTGGSTGKSLDLYLTEECSELRNACARRHDRWTGWEVGEPVGAAWGNPELPRDLKGWLKQQLLDPFIYLDTMSVNEKSVREFCRDWERVHPTLLYGHAHSLYLLAGEVRALGIDAIRPRGILSTSMMLMPHERRLIEDVFGVKVTDRYGCEEVSLIASECERHEGMHLNIEHLFVEFLRDDGSEAVAGETGSIVVTDLINYAMPLIRYQVEDVGIPSQHDCSCGRGLPLVEQIAGRVADFLIRGDGSKVAGVSLIENTLTRIPGIEQMQIVQEALDRLVVRVVPAVDFQTATERDLAGYLRGLFGPQTRVDIELTGTIPSESSGKYRFSICKILS